MHTPVYLQLYAVADTHGMLVAYGIILASIAGIIWPIPVQPRFSLDVVYWHHLNGDRIMNGWNKEFDNQESAEVYADKMEAKGYYATIACIGRTFIVSVDPEG